MHEDPISNPISDQISKPSSPSSLRRRKVLAAIGAASAGAMVPGVAHADTFPSSQIRMVVPFPAGDSADLLGRIAAKAMSGSLGQDVFVDNRPGAGGNIAANYVYHAHNDGYTVLVAGQGIMAINLALYHGLEYDPTKFNYVGPLGEYANVLLINPKVVPVSNLAGLIALAKSKPNQISFGSNGVGSLTHLTTEVLASAAGVQFQHVPYKGSSPLSIDLLAGRIGFCVTGSILANQLLKQGGVVALVVTTPQRLPQLPQVPTLIESGYPSLSMPSWWSLVTTPGVPADVLGKLQRSLATAVASPEYNKAIAAQSTLPLRVSVKDSASFLASERARWVKAVKESGAIVS